MLTPELTVILNGVAARLQNTKFKSLAQMQEVKKALSGLMDQQIADHVQKTAAANRRKAAAKAEKEAYRSKFREQWAMTSLPVGATIKATDPKLVLQVVALHQTSLLVTDLKGEWMRTITYAQVMKVQDINGKFLDVYEVAARQETPVLRLPTGI